MIQELGICIGLHRDGKASRQTRTQVAKARRRDQPILVFDQRTCHVDGLIETSACAVNRENRLAGSAHGVFQRTERRLQGLAVTGEAGARQRKIPGKDRVDADCSNDEDCENQKIDTPGWMIHLGSVALPISRAARKMLPIARTSATQLAAKPGRSPAVFFLLVFALSGPFWLVASLGQIQLLPGLPLSAVMVLCPLVASLL